MFIVIRRALRVFFRKNIAVLKTFKKVYIYINIQQILILTK